MYLVKWPSSWEPPQNLSDCSHKIDEFENGVAQEDEIDSVASSPGTKKTNSEWDVEKIIGKRIKGRKVLYSTFLF